MIDNINEIVHIDTSLQEPDTRVQSVKKNQSVDESSAKASMKAESSKTKFRMTKLFDPYTEILKPASLQKLDRIRQQKSKNKDRRVATQSNEMLPNINKKESSPSHKQIQDART